jgi:8-oxo-dGTP diphosphatase
MSKAGPIEVIARGVLLRGDSVLLCRNIAGGYFYLPGGHVEFGESAATALEREFLEECGLAVRGRELILVTEAVFTTSSKRHHEVNLVFHVEHVGEPGDGKVASREPEIAFEWHRLSLLRQIDLRPVRIREWLATWKPGAAIGVAWASDFAP